MSLLGMLNATCTIKRPTFTTGTSSGFPTHSANTSTTGVRCSIQAATGDERRTDNRMDGVVTFDVFFPWGTDVQEQDTIDTIAVNGSTTFWTGKTLAVTSPPMDDAGCRDYVRVTAELRTGGGYP